MWLGRGANKLWETRESIITFSAHWTPPEFLSVERALLKMLVVEGWDDVECSRAKLELLQAMERVSLSSSASSLLKRLEKQNLLASRRDPPISFKEDL